jgi:hypothetical protein
MSEPETPVPDAQETWSTNFAMMVRIRGAFSDEELRLALARVRVLHPALLQRQLEDGNIQQLSLQDPPEFPLEVRAGCTETDWIDVARAALQQKFSPAGPLARFALLRLPDDGADLVAVFHHWVAEGISGMYVVRDILRLLGNPALDLLPIPMPPNMLDLIPKAARQDVRTRLRVWQELNALRFSLLRDRLWKAKQARPVFSEQELALKREVCLLPGGLSVQQTSALLAHCRAERTSVHAAVCVAWLKAYAEMLEERKSWVRTVSSPVNVRNRLTQPIPETCGGYLSIVETSVDCAPGRDFWQIAREFKQRLIQGSADHRLFVEELTIAKIVASFPKSQIFEAIGRYFSRASKYDFSVTNLGQVDIPAGVGSLTVEAFYGPLVNSLEDERTVGVSTFAGKLTFVFLFRRSGLDPARAGQLLERAIAYLDRAVSFP